MVGFCWGLMLLWTLGMNFESTCTVYWKWRVSRIFQRLWKMGIEEFKTPHHTVHVCWTWCSGYDCRSSFRGMPVPNLWIANFWFSFYEVCVQNHWVHKTLWSLYELRTPTLVVQVRLPLVKIEYVFAFKIWYCELCVKKPKENIFSFVFFLAFSLLNLSWKFGLTTFPFSFSKVSSLLFYYF